MTENAEPQAAAPSAMKTVQAEDPTAPHDLTVVLRCASEAAAYNILMDLASKMHLQCSGLDDLPAGRSLPEAGAKIGLLSRGALPQDLGFGVVTATNPAPTPTQ